MEPAAEDSLRGVRERAERTLHEAQVRYIASGDVDIVALELAACLAEANGAAGVAAAAAGAAVDASAVEWAPPGRWTTSPAQQRTTPRQQRYAAAAAAAGSPSLSSAAPGRSRLSGGARNPDDSLGSPPTSPAPRCQRRSPTHGDSSPSTNGMDRHPRPRVAAADVDRMAEPLPRRRAYAAKTRAKAYGLAPAVQPWTPSTPPPRVPRTTRAVEVRKAKTDEAAREVAREAKRASRIAERRHRERDELAKAGDMNRLKKMQEARLRLTAGAHSYW